MLHDMINLLNEDRELGSITNVDKISECRCMSDLHFPVVMLFVWFHTGWSQQRVLARGRHRIAHLSFFFFLKLKQSQPKKNQRPTFQVKINMFKKQ